MSWIKCGKQEQGAIRVDHELETGWRSFIMPIRYGCREDIWLHILSRCLSVPSAGMLQKSSKEPFFPSLLHLGCDVQWNMLIFFFFLTKPIKKYPGWHAMLWQALVDCVNHIALCYIKWHIVMWLIQHGMTHHNAKYHLEHVEKQQKTRSHFNFLIFWTGWRKRSPSSG